MTRRRLQSSDRPQAAPPAPTHEELVKREHNMRALVDDLRQAKERIERQAATLKATNRKLREMAVLKDEFVAKASHELRTPLTSIKEGLSLLLDNALGATTPDQQDFLKTMDGDIDRLTELINNMLDISKIEAGRMRLARRRLDLRALVDSLMRSYQPLIERRTVRAESGELPKVFADSNRMLQVLSNLFSNAIKFTAEDGQITFRLARRGDEVCVAVEDNGPGISQDELGKLFQKFSQLGSRESQSRGTGLGLVVVKELVELHGGRVEVTSEEGRGTTFTMHLPVYSDELAMTETFRELRGFASTEGEHSISLIAVDARTILGENADGASTSPVIEKLAGEIRQQVHRGDVVLSVAPSWVVILAVTDAKGCEAMAKRLRATLCSGSQLRFGIAVHPAHGREAVALFAHATTHLNHRLGRLGPPAAGGRPIGAEPPRGS